MSTFELVTACLSGAVFGVALAAAGGWRHIGGGMGFVFGAIGGLLGGLAARVWLPVQPGWGAMPYHPLVLLGGAVGGIAVILVVRGVFGPDSPPRERRPGTP